LVPFCSVPSIRSPARKEEICSSCWTYHPGYFKLPTENWERITLTESISFILQSILLNDLRAWVIKLTLNLLLQLPDAHILIFKLMVKC